NGRTVLGDGGGICQISTTLFRAALNAGLPIISRKAHAYRVGYYENDSKPGMDATVFAPSVDFKVKNDTGHYILIQTIIDPKKTSVLFEFYGQKDGRKVTLSPIKVWDVSPPPEPRFEDDPTLPRGTKKQVDFAAKGGKSSFTYKVEKNGEILQDRTFYSSYRPWQAVFLVGTKD
ncbi:MAG: VanW family protein, partial [Candidatus Roizmanbacteria bacterium]